MCCPSLNSSSSDISCWDRESRNNGLTGDLDTTRLQVPRSPFYAAEILISGQIAGFFTGGALAIRGGYKAARNGAISCAILLAVIEGVGIGFQKMFAGATKLEVFCQRNAVPYSTVLTFFRPHNRLLQTKRSLRKSDDTVHLLRYNSNSTHSTLLRFSRARTCIFVRIHDGQHYRWRRSM
jgi:hypothetical protein